MKLVVSQEGARELARRMACHQGRGGNGSHRLFPRTSSKRHRSSRWEHDSLHDSTTQFTTSCSVISQTGVSGCTWSTVNKFLPDWEFNIPEPQDRIDFILYKGIFFKELLCDVIFERSR